MTNEENELPAVHLFRYMVASGDMYYTEEQQRDVMLGRDHRGHIRIWGATSDGDPFDRVDLCRIFLEYALYCCTWCDSDEALFHMQDLGAQLGHRLAAYLRDNPGLLAADDPMLRALEQIFGTIGADCIEEHIDSGVRFLVSHCELEDVAQRSGLCNVELAHHGINALCRTLILDMSPRSVVFSAPDALPEFMFTVTSPALA